MAHTFTNMLVHAVFSTSDRTPMFLDEIRPDMHAYLGGIVLSPAPHDHLRGVRKAGFGDLGVG